MVCLQRWHSWCHRKLQLSRRKFCVHHSTTDPVTLCKTTYTRCLAVTCHLHFWQDDRGLLRATAVTRGGTDTEIRVSRRKFSRRSCRDSIPRPFNHESSALSTELSCSRSDNDHGEHIVYLMGSNDDYGEHFIVYLIAGGDGHGEYFIVYFIGGGDDYGKHIIVYLIGSGDDYGEYFIVYLIGSGHDRGEYFIAYLIGGADDHGEDFIVYFIGVGDDHGEDFIVYFIGVGDDHGEHLIGGGDDQGEHLIVYLIGADDDHEFAAQPEGENVTMLFAPFVHLL